MRMEIIQWLCDKIDDEIDDSIDYSTKAIECRDDYPALADAIIKIAEEEMKHMGILHAQVTAIIDAYRKANGEPPEAMQMLYKITHKKHIAHAAEARAYMSMYKE
jgi:Mn-containing catalase